MSSLGDWQSEFNTFNDVDFNDKIKLNNTIPSIIFYSLVKSGSTFVASLLKRLVQDVGIQWISLGGYTWKIRLQDDYKPEEISLILKPYGYCYSCIRDPKDWSFLDVASYQKLLILRDPRDVLTSSYFSFGYSHKISKGNPICRKEMLKLKIGALKNTIDDYVLKVMPKYIDNYQYYIQTMVNQPDVVFLTYEQMVGNFDPWLNTLIAGLKLDINPQLIDQIKREVDFTVEEEDIYAHKRQVTPGDHRRKLKPETIEILNASFAEILDVLGYSI